ncbi:flavodoxin domain-containing protein [Agromyces humi]|uniref:flavodoxin domain-containing protein n=1 Tax=Agromyces humi TaxID=1766800 RepID=UPI00135BD1DE|nr:flavodoxin domain-containing protein [Agromyces humi]
MKVLIAYASKYGATEGIARRIGETLQKRGLEIDVARCADVRDPSGYDAYVIGSATYAFNWRKDARKFVERNAGVLSARPTWLFSSGPLGTETVDKDGNDVLKGAEPKQFADYADLLHPRGAQVFRGAYHHDKIRGGDRIVAWMPAIRDILPEGDFREWDAIDAWADSIADALGAIARG